MVLLDVAALRESVRASGLKQKYIAEKVGVAEKTLSYMLTGRTKLPVGVYANICAVLGRPITAFVKVADQSHDSTQSIPQNGLLEGR